MPNRENTSEDLIEVPSDSSLLHQILKSPIRTKIVRTIVEQESKSNAPDITLSQIARLTRLNKRTVFMNLAALEKSSSKPILLSTWETKEIRGRPIWVKIYRTNSDMDLDWVLDLE